MSTVSTRKIYPKATGLVCLGTDEYNDHKRERMHSGGMHGGNRFRRAFRKPQVLSIENHYT